METLWFNLTSRKIELVRQVLMSRRHPEEYQCPFDVVPYENLHIVLNKNKRDLEKLEMSYYNISSMYYEFKTEKFLPLHNEVAKLRVVYARQHNVYDFTQPFIQYEFSGTHVNQRLSRGNNGLENILEGIKYHTVSEQMRKYNTYLDVVRRLFFDRLKSFVNKMYPAKDFGLSVLSIDMNGRTYHFSKSRMSQAETFSSGIKDIDSSWELLYRAPSDYVQIGNGSYIIDP